MIVPDLGALVAVGIVAGLGIAAPVAGALAEDKYFSKADAKKIGAEVVAALPPPRPGWKATGTYSDPVPTGTKGKNRYAPGARRTYSTLSGDGQMYLMIIFVGPAYHTRLERKYQRLTKDPKKGVKVMVNGTPAYLVRSSPHTNAVFSHYMRVGPFAIYGDHSGKGVNYGFVAALLRSIDVAKLQAVNKKLGK